MILWKTLFFRHNRRENEQLCTEYGLCDYIRAQEDAGVREMRYGLGHMAYNGCEVIACHHALLSLGIPSSLWQTADFSSGTVSGSLVCLAHIPMRCFGSAAVTVLCIGSIMCRFWRKSGNCFHCPERMLFYIRTGTQGFAAFTLSSCTKRPAVIW